MYVKIRRLKIHYLRHFLVNIMFQSFKQYAENIVYSTGCLWTNDQTCLAFKKTTEYTDSEHKKTQAQNVTINERKGMCHCRMYV